MKTSKNTTKSILILTLFMLLSVPAVNAQEIKGKTISEKAKKILREIMLASGVSSVTISSTNRTAEEQAGVMYRYIKKYSVDAALKLYGPEGDAVIRVYAKSLAAGDDASTIKSKMLTELNKQLDSAYKNNRLMHVGREHAFEVFDISILDMEPKLPVTNVAAFEKQAKLFETTGEIFRFLGRGEAEKEALHFEIRK